MHWDLFETLLKIYGSKIKKFIVPLIDIPFRFLQRIICNTSPKSQLLFQNLLLDQVFWKEFETVTYDSWRWYFRISVLWLSKNDSKVPIFYEIHKKMNDLIQTRNPFPKKPLLWNMKKTFMHSYTVLWNQFKLVLVISAYLVPSI